MASSPCSLRRGATGLEEATLYNQTLLATVSMLDAVQHESSVASGCALVGSMVGREGKGKGSE